MTTHGRSIIIHTSLMLVLVFTMALSGCVDPPAQNMLTGTISFEGQNISFSNATAYVTIKDASIADTASRVVAEQTIQGLSITQGTNSTFLYAVATGKLEQGKEYSLSVHVDVDGNGNISQADYITTQRYPLIAGLKTLDAVVQKVSGDGAMFKIFTGEQSGSSVDLKTGEPVTIRLEENPTTGYSWNMSFTPGLELMKDEFFSSADTELVGAGGVHEWTVKANSAGQYNVSGIYKRPWEDITGDEDTFNLTLNISS
ncbi:MAG: Chagasin family peptidase inhibitor I42 [Methanomethylovorans sp. PtaU1.Bin093]|uniref:protease inhibitor I42 family protein n=1 Tax=Methanomethylovorans sp. PtaU1.Bin093 TaxID=1811679 RepID=UPI0009C89132|nr:protease inhibitor I42 family protein [Methanomethylovorans sp. PtaU1.Bin093]OPY18373.1 MAG: Chagasin family peptidase inhibitor I42 [Methanomethylovorans sp. PtaU1.Bin093]